MVSKTLNVPQETKDRNKALCERFPFLIPSNRWSGIRITDAANGGYFPGNPADIPNYDWEYTELDDMPNGWRKAFGEQMCQEIMDQLVRHNHVDYYRITQIKEKYGSLRWYDNGMPGGEEGWKIIQKYEDLSRRTCIRCGKPAKWISRGWICPWCDDCAADNLASMVPIDEYYRNEEPE